MELVKKYETDATVVEDKTCYGNRFYLQLEDTVGNDNSEVRSLVGKTMQVTILFEEGARCLKTITSEPTK